VNIFVNIGQARQRFKEEEGGGEGTDGSKEEEPG
jgi:hypothetical protein